MAEDRILTLSKLSKEFPGVRALDDVDFDLNRGEVHALIGENGAGKSTLIKVLGGLLQPTSGTIELRGEAVTFDDPLRSQAAGISIIAQEFDLVPQLTVAENIFLGHEPRRAVGFIDWPTARRRSAELLAELGLEVGPNERVEALSVADKQLVEIAKALSQDFEVVIMDEPTAALNSSEVDRLFDIVARLRERGVAIVYVSHRLSEIFRVADRVTVLRDGSVVGNESISSCDEDSLVSMMLGGLVDQSLAERSEPAPAEKATFSVRNIAIPGVLEDVSFDVQPGEILGLAGLMGSGRAELLKALFGLQAASGGEVRVEDRPVTLKSPRQALEHGVFLLPEDRKAQGILPHLSSLENLLVGQLTGGLKSSVLIDGRSELKEYEEVKEFLGIRAHSPAQPVVNLSGGNQQKILLGRALISGCRVLLLNEPTRGVDVGAKVEIYNGIRDLAERGVAVVVSSSEAPELVTLSHRCLVLSAGTIVKELRGQEITEEGLLAASVSADRPEEVA